MFGFTRSMASGKKLTVGDPNTVLILAQCDIVSLYYHFLFLFSRLYICDLHPIVCIPTLDRLCGNAILPHSRESGNTVSHC